MRPVPVTVVSLPGRRVAGVGGVQDRPGAVIAGPEPRFGTAALRPPAPAAGAHRARRPRSPALPGTQRRRLLGEGGDQPLLGERAGLELEDERASRPARPGQLADLAQLLPHRPGDIELLELQRVLRGPDVQGGGEQKLGDRVVQVAGDALSLQRVTLTLAALRLGELLLPVPLVSRSRRGVVWRRAGGGVRVPAAGHTG